MNLSTEQMQEIVDSGEFIAAARDYIDDCSFRDDDFLDQEGREEWRGHLTGRQMAGWLRCNYDGGVRAFIYDNDLGC